jgi:uncharacterized protein YbjT (DUF2867 family)
MRVMVLGGDGSFGARICRAFADDRHIELIVAGRDSARSAAFASGLPGCAQGVSLDMGASEFVVQAAKDAYLITSKLLPGSTLRA